MRKIVMFCLTIGLAFASLPAAAQDRDETLADVRQQLTTLYVEIQRMKRELSTTGAAGSLTVSGSPLERLDAIEAEVQRLTARTEELEHRVERVVTDGTNRIGDLEFRLVELEGGDVSALGETTTLGGSVEATGSATPPVATGESMTSAPDANGTAAPDAGPQMAVGEQSDFQAAQALLDAGDFAAAAEAFQNFSANYPGSPYAPAAQLGRGRALEAQGQINEGARAYLDAFTAAPEAAETAPVALFRLGRLLGQLGQSSEACVTLSEVPNRFPGSAAAEEARAEMQTQGCS